MDSLLYNSVETLPGYESRAAFTVSSSSVFREDTDIVPIILNDKLSYIPWGGDNRMPFNIIDLIEKDETLATCQLFNAEVCFGSGLRYNTCIATPSVKSEVEVFFLDNDIASYYLGVCQDFKHFGFAVSVIILSRDGTKIVRLLRKEGITDRRKQQERIVQEKQSILDFLTGVIDNSVLIAFGEILTFVGSLFGIDYHYKYKNK